MLDRYVIWDIDNCLADDQWRQQFIEWDKTGDERYDNYNSLMERDPVAHVTEFQFMCRIATPIFFTGRTIKWRDYTKNWLMKRLGLVKSTVYFRGEGRTEPPAQLKAYMLKKLLRTHVKTSQIIGAFDDIPAVVEMYKQFGIPASVLAIHSDLSGAYKPEDLVLIPTTA